MKKFLKWSAIIIVSLIVILFLVVQIISEPLPEGKEGAGAEALAQKMLVATDQAAWDTTVFVRWDFAGLHQYLWDRKRHLVQVEWRSNRVLINTQNQEGKAWEDGQELEGEATRKKLDEAWTYFCNDSFWLNASGKIYDPGTTRKLVNLEDGSEGLLITYASGGVTPGDSYLWILDESGLPIKWKLWVNIFPIGGMETTWEQWQELSTGAKVATFHDLGVYQLKISKVEAENDWRNLGLDEEPFVGLDE